MPTPMRGGKNYYGVNERLAVAHGEGLKPVGIASIVTTPMVLGNMVAVVATITFKDGRVFTGMSEAKLDATTGADKDSPLECADTSAVGRALAFAGYFGSDEGLAGPEEIRTAQQREANRAHAQQRQVPQPAQRTVAQAREMAAATPADPTAGGTQQDWLNRYGEWVARAEKLGEDFVLVQDLALATIPEIQATIMELKERVVSTEKARPQIPVAKARR